MASKVDSLAFEPTPALERDPDNYSPLNAPNGKTVEAHHTHVGFGRGVHFSDLPAYDGPVRRAQSIATSSIPLLPSVASASQIRRHAPQLGAVPDIDVEAYLGQSRLLLEELRANHDREKRSWQSERNLWQLERKVLLGQVADLEAKLNKTKPGAPRRLSNDAKQDVLHSFRMDFPSLTDFSMKPSTRTQSHPSIQAPRIWEGPTQYPPTRVFVDDIVSSPPPTSYNLPPISENEAASFSPLSREVSPTSNPLIKAVSISNPMGEIDAHLDGINFRSESTVPSFAGRVRTSSTEDSPSHSPSPKPKQPLINGKRRLDISRLLSPLNEQLTRNAGHTPMNFDGMESSDMTGTDPSQASTPTRMTVPDLSAENPPERAPSRKPSRPRETSNSYFVVNDQKIQRLSKGSDEYRTEDLLVEINGEKRLEANARPNKENEQAVFDEGEGREEHEELADGQSDCDPALKPPFALDSEGQKSASEDFLSKVDQKLQEAARQSDDDDRADKADRPGGRQSGDNKENRDQDPDMPPLRMKPSKNFGSAFGERQPGRV